MSDTNRALLARAIPILEGLSRPLTRHAEAVRTVVGLLRSLDDAEHLDSRELELVSEARVFADELEAAWQRVERRDDRSVLAADVNFDFILARALYFARRFAGGTR